MATVLDDVLALNEIELTVLDNMRLALYPQEIARAGEHNSAYFRIVQQPPGLIGLPCRAEVKTADGNDFYVIVTDGAFLLTSDITVHGTGSLQLVYADGEVDHRTQIAQYYVAPSLFAVDPSDPEYQDGLAQLSAAAFADASLQGANTLVFSNIGGVEVDRVTLPGVDEATLDQTYLRLNGIQAMQGTLRIDGVNRGMVLDASATASAVYSDGTRLFLRRPVGNAEVQIEDNGGDSGSRSNVLTERSADLRYLTPGSGNNLYLLQTGGIMTGPIRTIGLGPPQLDTLVWREWVEQQIAAIPPGGGGGGLDEAQASLLFLRLDGDNRMAGNLFINGAGIGLVLDPQQTAAVVYADGTLRFRRGSTNAEPTIENNDGNPSSRQPLINQQSGDARYVQRTGGAASAMSGNVVINGVSNGVQFSTTAFIYAPAAGLVLRRGLVGNNVYTEANSGDVATRRRLLTEDDIAPSLNLLMVADVPLSGTFQNIFSVAYPVPRGGNSRVQVTITGGLRAAQISSLGMVQVNCTPGTQVQNVFTYTVDSGGGIPVCNGFSITFDVDVSGTSPTIAAQIRNLTTTTLVLVGGNSDPERTLVTISDLGAR